MQDNYESFMYLTPNDLNQVENKIEELTSRIQENIYDNQQSSLRNIQVGDDLSGKTLYLSFPKDSYEDITSSDVIFFMKAQDVLGLYYQLYNNLYKTISVRTFDETTSSGFRNYYVYSKNINSDTNNPYLNNIRFKLPNDYGIVTEIDDESPFYQYVKIYENEEIIPDYITKEWVVNEIPYMQDIDHIEQGIKNLGDYFTKSVGWITTKDWLKTNSITDRSDYGVGSKGFSYQDINRWIHNLNLIEQENMENVTIWNTDKTEYEWEGHTEKIDYKVLYENSDIQYGGSDIYYEYVD